ncbi:NaeI family type II restriction endonuclease [Streptomyces sp. NPDC021354]|uniref:NaeI family type II restriction endonuclease n=1 Tax=Streptomyces sp. NPDC021354 TaxID=3154793 RepID=UPI0033EBC81D
MSDEATWEVLPGLEQPAQADPELDTVGRHLLQLDPDGKRFAGAVRRTFDMLLDGQHTGRFKWQQLHKTEKTHCGTLIEINLQREFDFADGVGLDYEICGVDVDCKYSQDMWKWMIPPEAVGKICLVVWASDDEAIFSAGLVRMMPEFLNLGDNRDSKKTLRASHRSAVRWLFDKAPLQENVLLRLAEADVAAIFGQRTGQRRVNELFRRATRRRVSRTAVATVATQDDYMKRVRYNGGSRDQLRDEGIVILGDYRSHVQVARRLMLPEPGPGEFVSARLAKWRHRHGDRPRVMLEGQEWVLADEDDEPERAPKLPSTNRSE